MLHEVKHSESNPPLYYVIAWGWAKVFGLGEVGLRSLSALFGAATIPVAYFIGRELSGRRAGYITAAIVAVNPMLIWYSQEARGYALLVFLAALSFLFFLRALRTHDNRDLALWSLASIGALTTHYFARLPGGDRGSLAAGRPAGRLAPGCGGGGRHRRGRAGPDPAGGGAGQSPPHRLDREQPAARAHRRNRRQLPDRRDRPCDRRAAAEQIRGHPGDPDPRRARPGDAPRKPPGEARGRDRPASSGWASSRSPRPPRWPARTTSSSATCCPP